MAAARRAPRRSATLQGVTPDPDPADPVAVSVAAYSEGAEDYAAHHGPKMLDRVQRFAASLPAPSLILDAGCGPGRDLARFAALGHVPRGVELNPVFAAMAARQAPVWPVDLRRVGAHFPPGLFDGVWACASLVHLPRDEAADVLEQFATVVRPGGRLYACVRTTGRTGWLDEPDGRRWYQTWAAGEFAGAVAGASFAVEQVDEGPYVEVWASRPG